jgi:hypothetical protein
VAFERLQSAIGRPWWLLDTVNDRERAAAPVGPIRRRAADDRTPR